MSTFGTHLDRLAQAIVGNLGQDVTYTRRVRIEGYNVTTGRYDMSPVTYTLSAVVSQESVTTPGLNERNRLRDFRIRADDITFTPEPLDLIAFGGTTYSVVTVSREAGAEVYALGCAVVSA